MEFSDIFREERYYCNHLFRLLCHEKETGGAKSGLAEVLSALDCDTKVTPANVAASEIYTEVAVLRDIYFREAAKDAFVDKLYDQFLPIIKGQLKIGDTNPILPSQIRAKLGRLHPSKYAFGVRKTSNNPLDIRFYREYSALFSAKPDFLVIFEDTMFWFEAKCEEKFDPDQLRRTRNIARLCSSDLFKNYFENRNYLIVLIGSDEPHHKSLVSHKFLSWEQCSKISERILPGGADNYTTKSLRKMLELDHSARD